MRDLFERNRRNVLSKDPDASALNKTFTPSDYDMSDKKEESFNCKLIQYFNEKIVPDTKGPAVSYSGIEHNLGGKNSSCDTVIRSMMNSKPDIAVIYKYNNIEYLHFIECKFESGESSDSEYNKQRYIQWRIADFLCRYYLTDLEVSTGMKDKNSCLVQFVRKKLTASKENEIYIAKEIDRIAGLYDYFEIQPASDKDINKKIVELAERHGKLCAATGNVHYKDKEDAVLHKIVCSANYLRKMRAIIPICIL